MRSIRRSNALCNRRGKSRNRIVPHVQDDLEAQLGEADEIWVHPVKGLCPHCRKRQTGSKPDGTRFTVCRKCYEGLSASGLWGILRKYGWRPRKSSGRPREDGVRVTRDEKPSWTDPEAAKTMWGDADFGTEGNDS